MSWNCWIGAVVQRLADALHQVVVEVQVVHDSQTHAQHLVRLLQMADVGAGEIAADRAVTVLVNGALVPLIFQILDVDDAVPGKQMAVAGIPAGHHTVKQVDAAVDRLDDVAGGAHAHQIPDLVLRGMFLHRADDLIHHIGRFSHSQASQRVAVQVVFRNLLHVLHTKIQIGAALVDAEQQLVRIDCQAFLFQPGHLCLATQQPPGGTGAAVFGILVLRGVFDALIKGHGDGGTQIGLNLHALFRAHEDLVPVQMRMEGYPLLADVAELCQAEYLKSAAVGQDGPVPAGELVQAAHVGNHLVAGTQMQMIGIAQHDLRADVLQVKGRQSALDGAGCGNIHESRGLYRAVHRLENAAAGMALLFEQTIWHEVWSLLLRRDHSASSQNALKVR